MSRKNPDLALLMYEVFIRRDLDAMLALMHDEVEIESRLVAMEGSYHGHEGVRRWWSDLLASNSGGPPDRAKLAEVMRRHGLMPVPPAAWAPPPTSDRRGCRNGRNAERCIAQHARFSREAALLRLPAPRFSSRTQVMADKLESPRCATPGRVVAGPRNQYRSLARTHRHCTASRCGKDEARWKRCLCFTT